MGHRTHQFPLNRQQLLQMLGHAIEGRRQAPYRVRTASWHPGFQAALGDAGGGSFQPAQAAFQLTHQQVDNQADQAQAEDRDQYQPLCGVRVHLVQRTDLQHPRGTDHAGKHPDRIALLAQRHHRVALGHPPTLVFVHVRLINGDQPQVEAKALVLLELGQPSGLLGHRNAHQFVSQQVDGRPGQLLADLLHLPGQHQLFLVTDQPVHPRCVRSGLLHQRLAAEHTGTLG